MQMHKYALGGNKKISLSEQKAGLIKAGYIKKVNMILSYIANFSAILQFGQMSGSL